MNAIIDWAGEQSFRVLKLAVTSNNETAIAFYMRFGFSLTGRTEPYPNDPALVECEMSKTLH